MRPVAVVIPSALVWDPWECGTKAAVMAGIETELIVEADPEATGFTRTVNRALERAPDGHDVLLLNDDVSGFYPGWLQQLSEAMYSREDIGIIGPSGNCATGPIDTWATGNMTGLLSVLHFPFFCALIRRECYEQIGKLDERYIHYASDYDYCDRGREAGWLMVWCRDVVVEHEMNGSEQRPAWAGHDLSLYQLQIKRWKREGRWIKAQPL